MLPSVSMAEKVRCLKDPMCFWSWFEEKCYCDRNPCDTLYCYPDLNKSDEICYCSMLLCQWNETTEACFRVHNDGEIWCVCKSSFKYPRYKPKLLRSFCDRSKNISCQLPGVRDDQQKALKSLQLSPEAYDLLNKLMSSQTDDVRDVERFFSPAVSVLDNYGMPFDSLILSCSFGTENCKNMVTLYSPLYGKCYMFNYVSGNESNSYQTKVTTQPGRDHGLQLYMQSLKQDAIPLLTRQIGVRIVVHDPHSIPIVSQNGIDIRPGDMASLSVEYHEIKRLGKPWGRCANDGDDLGNNYTTTPYSQSDCEHHCINMEVFRRCNCFHPRYLASDVEPQNVAICPTNSTDHADHCFISVVEDNDHGKIKCRCPAACLEKKYDITKSSSQLNPEFFKLVKKAKTLTTDDKEAFVTNSETEFSMMGVQIFYNSFFVSRIDETAIYSWESLIANIGGNMGLFLGVSIVTLLEVVEFLAEILINLLSTKKDNSSKTYVQSFK